MSKAVASAAAKAWLPDERMKELRDSVSAFTKDQVHGTQLETCLLKLVEDILEGQLGASQVALALKTLEIKKENTDIGICIANVLWLSGTQVGKL